MLSLYNFRYPMLSYFRLSICWTGRWTVDELKDMIARLKQKDFDPTDVDTNLHILCLVYPQISQHIDSIS